MAFVTQKRSPEESFLRATDDLISEIVRLDHALQRIGLLGLGPGTRANDFRSNLRTLRKFFSTVQTRSETRKKLESLKHASERLFTELGKFTGIPNDQMLPSFFKLILELTAVTYRESATSDSERMNGLEAELPTVFESIRSVLEDFVFEVTRSVNIQSVENQKYVNLTVIATFLSGVTASSLQIVGPTTSGHSVLAVAVNACLFSSLIISSASAAQSLMAISWIQNIVFVSFHSSYQSMARNTNICCAWLRRGPLISLLVAGALFVVGIVLFMFSKSSNQHRVTSVVTTCFAGLLTFSIMKLTACLYWDHRKVTLDLERKCSQVTYRIMTATEQTRS